MTTFTSRRFVNEDLVDPKTGSITLNGTQIFEQIYYRTEELYRQIGDETTALTTGAAKLTFYMPYDLMCIEVIIGVTTAPTGQALIVDVNQGGATLFDTGSSGVRPSVDAGESTSLTAAKFVFTDGAKVAALRKGAAISVDIDQIGSGTAGAGLKLSLVGYRP